MLSRDIDKWWWSIKAPLNYTCAHASKCIHISLWLQIIQSLSGSNTHSTCTHFCAFTDFLYTVAYDFDDNVHSVKITVWTCISFSCWPSSFNYSLYHAETLIPHSSDSQSEALWGDPFKMRSSLIFTIISFSTLFFLIELKCADWRSNAGIILR